MSDRLDLCVEKILSRMIIDDDQRRQIEAEIRDHLDELVAEARRRGLNEEDAEAEAVRQFGDSSTLTRAFNLPGSRWWVVFDNLVLAGMIASAFLIFPADPQWFLKFISIWLVYTVLILHQKLWPKVEINGGILIRPHFRRARHIEFSQLKHVRQERGHLFGAPNVIFEYEGGKVKLHATARGMRAAGLAIEALIPGIFEPKLMERLRRLRTRLRTETLTQQIAGTVFWLFAMIAYLLGARLLWAGEGFPWPSVFGMSIAILLGPIQAWHLPNRARAAFLNMTAVILAMALMTTIGATIWGNAPLIRQSVLITSMTMAIGLILTWWRGRRGTLLVVCIAALCIFIAVRGRLGNDFLEGQTAIGSVQLPTYSFTWLDRGQAAAWIDESSTNSSASLVMVERGAASKKFSFEGVIPHLVPPRPGSRLQVATLSPQRENPSTTMLMWMADDRLDSATLPYRVFPSMRTESAWSPDGRYYYFQCLGKDEKTVMSRLLDMHTRKVVELNRAVGQHVQWLDANSFRSCHVQEISASSTTSSLTVYETDLLAGASRVLRTFTISAGDNPRILAGMRYALMANELLDLESGKRIALPSAGAIGSGEYDWDPAGERLCYVADQVSYDVHGRSHARAIIVFHPSQGIVSRLNFNDPQMFGPIKLSPDRKRVLIRRSSRAGGLGYFNALTQTEVWDLGPVRCSRLFTHGVIAGILMRAGEPFENGFTLPAWSPDGFEVVYPAVVTNRFAKPSVYMCFMLASP